MLTRIYIDNYRCFQSFELQSKDLSLILGANGTGKSSVFEVLHKIHQLVGGYAGAAQLFERSTCTRWEAVAGHTFMLSFVKGEEVYTYRLDITFKRGKQASITEESIVGPDGAYLYLFSEETARVYKSPQKGIEFPAGGNISPLSNLPSSLRVGALRWVIERIVGLWVVGPVPPMIDPIARVGDDYLQPDLSNFASWLRKLTLEQAPTIRRIQRALREALGGFQSFDFKRQGAGRFVLILVFKGSSSKAKPVTFAFNELSEGQRALIVLHTLLHHVPGKGTTLCIDEPEGYLALPEIQPWLNELIVQVEDGVRQVFLISHHPRLIDFLAADHGVWLERTPVGPVKARTITTEPGGLKPSELIARGWLNG